MDDILSDIILGLVAVRKQHRILSFETSCEVKLGE